MCLGDWTLPDLLESPALASHSFCEHACQSELNDNIKYSIDNNDGKMEGPHRNSVVARERVPLLPLKKSESSGIYDNERRRSHLLFWRLRLFTMLTIITFGITMLFARQSVAGRSPEPESADICLSPECVLASAEILSSRSPNYANIEPCDDFRTYMCEGWDNAHDLRPDQSDASSLSVLAERGQTLLRHILEAPFPKSMDLGKHSSLDEENFEKLQDAYGACLNETAIKSRGAAPLKDLVEKARASFKNNNSSTTSLSQTCSYLMSIGIEPLVSLDIQADDKDPDVNVIYANAPYNFGLPAKEYYKDEEVLEKYSKMIQEVAEAFKEELGSDSVFLNQFSAKALVDFEIKLAKASPSEEEREDVQKYYNPRSLDEVAAMVPQIDIPALIKSRNSEFKATKVIVGSPDYLVAISKILNETEQQTIMAYLTWKTVQSFASSVDCDAVLPLKRFNNVLGGREPDAKPDRWRTCLRHVDNGLGWILSRFFVEKAFSEEARMYGDEVILDIKKEFTRKLEASKWMSKDSRKVAIDKVHSIVQKIGYPTASPDVRDPRALEQYYAAINITRTGFFDNAVSMIRDSVVKEWEKATKPVDRNEWGMTASTVNAYYNPAGNDINFPAGIMQPAVFYPPEVPKYLTYGAFGAVSGHELSHAFDSNGRHFDQNGNYTDWWDAETVAEFEHKAQCFIDQYSNFTISGPDGKAHHLNGRLTLGENLADAGGLSAAFNAWKRREAEKPTQLLPGLQDYTKEQAFFLSFGHVWCGKTREAEKLRRLYSDPHSPSAARVLLTVANSDEFRESFKCKNKRATCKLW